MRNWKMRSASFDLAIRIDPNYVDAWIKKGYAHFHLGEYTVALSSYDKALEIDLNNAEAWNLKGLCTTISGIMTRLSEHVRKQLILTPMTRCHGTIRRAILL